MSGDNIKAYTAAFFSMAFFAFSYVWFKVANEVYRPVTIVFLRLVIAVFILTLYLILTGNMVRIKKSDRKYFFFMSLFEPTLYFIFESHGLTHISSTVASVVVSTIPIFTAAGAMIFFRERITRFNWVGIVISFGGLLMFILTGNSNLVVNIKGILLMLLAVLCATGYNLILRRLTIKYRPVFIVNTQNLIGLTLFLPIFLISEWNHIPLMTFDRVAAEAILKLAFFASCGAFILLSYSVSLIGVTKANLFANLIPALTALFAFFTIGEMITIEKFLGIAVMIAGLYMAQITKFRKLPTLWRSARYNRE